MPYPYQPDPAYIPPRPTTQPELYLWEARYGRYAQPSVPPTAAPEDDTPMFSGNDQPALDYAMRAPWVSPGYFDPYSHQGDMPVDPDLDKLLRFIQDGDTSGMMQAPPPPEPEQGNSFFDALGDFGHYVTHGDPNAKAPITQLVDWWQQSPAGIYTKQTVEDLNKEPPKLEDRINDARTGQEIKQDAQGNYYMELPPQVDPMTGEVSTTQIPVTREYAAAAAESNPAGSNNEAGAGLQSFFTYLQGVTDELKVNPTPLFGGFSLMEIAKGPFEPAVKAAWSGPNAERYKEAERNNKPYIDESGRLQLPSMVSPIEPVSEGIWWMLNHPQEIGQHMRDIKEARNPANYAYIDTPQEREDAALVARGVRGWRDEEGQPLDIISTYRAGMEYVQEKGDRVAELRSQAAQVYAYSQSLTDLSTADYVGGYLYNIGQRDLIPLLNSNSIDTVLQIAAARLEDQAQKLEKESFASYQDARVPLVESILWDVGADIGGAWDFGMELAGATGKARRIANAADLVDRIDPMQATMNIARAQAGPMPSPTVGQRLGRAAQAFWGVESGDFGAVGSRAKSAWNTFADETGALQLPDNRRLWEIFNPYKPDLAPKEMKQFEDEFDELLNMDEGPDKFTRLENVYDKLGVPPSQQLVHPPGVGDDVWKEGKDAGMLDRLEGYMADRFDDNLLDRGPTVVDALSAVASDKNVPQWMRNAYGQSIEAINAIEATASDSHVIRLPVGTPKDRMTPYQKTDAFKTALAMSALSEQTGLNVDLFNIRYANDDTFDLLIPVVVNNEDILERNASYLGNPEAIAKANLNTRKAETAHELIGQWLPQPERKEYRFDYDPKTGKSAWKEYRPDPDDPTNPDKGEWLTIANAQQQHVGGPLSYSDTYIDDGGAEVVPPPSVTWDDPIMWDRAQDRAKMLPQDRTDPRGLYNETTKRYEWRKFVPNEADPDNPDAGKWWTISRRPAGPNWRKDPHLASLARSGDYYHQAGRLMAGNRIQAVEYFGKLPEEDWARAQRELGQQGLVFMPYELKENESWGDLPARVVPRLKEEFVDNAGPLPADAYELFKMSTLESPTYRPDDPDNFWNVVAETQQTLISRLFNADGATRPATYFKPGDFWNRNYTGPVELISEHPENAKAYQRIRNMVMGEKVQGPIPAPTDEFLYKWSRTPLRDTTDQLSRATRATRAQAAEEFNTAATLYNIFGFSNAERGTFKVEGLQLDSFDELLAADKMLENPKSKIPYYIDWESVTKFDDGTMRFTVQSAAETGRPKNLPSAEWRSAGKRMQEQLDTLEKLENPTADQVAQMRVLPEMIESWRNKRTMEIIKNGEPTSPDTWSMLNKWDAPLDDVSHHGYGARYPIPYTPPAPMTTAESIVGGAGTAWPQGAVQGPRSYDVPTKTEALSANVRQSFFDLDAMYRTAAESGMTLDNVRFTATGEFNYSLRPRKSGDPESLADVVGNSHIDYVVNTFIPTMQAESKAAREEVSAFVQNMLAEGKRRQELKNPPKASTAAREMNPLPTYEVIEPGPRSTFGPNPNWGAWTPEPQEITAPKPVKYDPKQIVSDLARTQEIEGQLGRYGGMESDLKTLLAEMKGSIQNEAELLAKTIPPEPGELEGLTKYYVPTKEQARLKDLKRAAGMKVPSLFGESSPEQLAEISKMLEAYQAAGADPEKLALARGLTEQLSAVDPKLRTGNWVDEDGIERGLRTAPEVERTQGYMAQRLFDAQDAGAMEGYVYVRLQPGTYKIDQKTGGITILDQGRQATRVDEATGQRVPVGPNRHGWMVYQDPREAAGVYEWQSTRTGGQRGITQDDFQMELRVSDNDMDIARNEGDIFDPTEERGYKQPEDRSRSSYPGTNAQQDAWNWFAGKTRENDGTRGAIQVTPASRTSYDIVAIKRQDLANVIGPEGIAAATVYGDPGVPSQTHIHPYRTGNYLHGTLNLPAESYQLGLNPQVEGSHFSWIDEAGKEQGAKAKTAESLYWEDRAAASRAKAEAEQRIEDTLDSVRKGDVVEGPTLGFYKLGEDGQRVFETVFNFTEENIGRLTRQQFNKLIEAGGSVLRTVIKGGEENLEKIPATLDDFKKMFKWAPPKPQKAAAVDADAMRILDESEFRLWDQQHKAIDKAYSYWEQGNPIPAEIKDELTALGLPTTPKKLAKIKEQLPAGMEYLERGEYVDKFLPMLRQQEKELLTMETDPVQSAWTMNRNVDLEMKRQIAIEQAYEFWNTDQPLPADVQAELQSLGLPTDRRTMERWQETPRPEIVPEGNRPEIAAYQPPANPNPADSSSMTVRDAENILNVGQNKLDEAIQPWRTQPAYNAAERRFDDVFNQARQQMQQFTERLLDAQQNANLAGAPMMMLGAGTTGYDDGDEETERPWWQTLLGVGLMAGGALAFGMARSPRRITFDDSLEKGERALGHINLPFTDTKPSVIPKGLPINVLDTTKVHEVLPVGEEEGQAVYRVIYENPLGGFAEDYVTDIPEGLQSGMTLEEGQSIGKQFYGPKEKPRPEYATKSLYDNPAPPPPGPSVGRTGTYNGRPVTIVQDTSETGRKTPYRVRTADGREVLVRYDEITWDGEAPPPPPVRETTKPTPPAPGTPVTADQPPPLPGTLSAEEYRAAQGAAPPAPPAAVPAAISEAPPVDDFEAQKAAAKAEFEAREAAAKAEEAAKQARQEAQQAQAEAQEAQGSVTPPQAAQPVTEAQTSRVGSTAQWRDPNTGNLVDVKVVSERDPKKGLPYQVQDPKTKRKWYVGADEVTWPQPPAEEAVPPVVAPAAAPTAADNAEELADLAEMEKVRQGGNAPDATTTVSPPVAAVPPPPAAVEPPGPQQKRPGHTGSGGRGGKKPPMEPPPPPGPDDWPTEPPEGWEDPDYDLWADLIESNQPPPQFTPGPRTAYARATAQPKTSTVTPVAGAAGTPPTSPWVWAHTGQTPPGMNAGPLPLLAQGPGAPRPGSIGAVNAMINPFAATAQTQATRVAEQWDLITSAITSATTDPDEWAVLTQAIAQDPASLVRGIDKSFLPSMANQADNMGLVHFGAGMLGNEEFASTMPVIQHSEGLLTRLGKYIERQNWLAEQGQADQMTPTEFKQLFNMSVQRGAESYFDAGTNLQPVEDFQNMLHTFRKLQAESTLNTTPGIWAVNAANATYIRNAEGYGSDIPTAVLTDKWEQRYGTAPTQRTASGMEHNMSTEVGPQKASGSGSYFGYESRSIVFDVVSAAAQQFGYTIDPDILSALRKKEVRQAVNFTPIPSGSVATKIGGTIENAGAAVVGAVGTGLEKGGDIWTGNTRVLGMEFGEAANYNRTFAVAEAAALDKLAPDWFTPVLDRMAADPMLSSAENKKVLDELRANLPQWSKDMSRSQLAGKLQELVKDQPVNTSVMQRYFGQEVLPRYDDLSNASLRSAQTGAENVMLEPSHRTNLDEWLSTFFTFPYFATHSAVNWAQRAPYNTRTVLNYSRWENASRIQSEQEQTPNRYKRTVEGPFGWQYSNLGGAVTAVNKMLPKEGANPMEAESPNEAVSATVDMLGLRPSLPFTFLGGAFDMLAGGTKNVTGSIIKQLFPMGQIPYETAGATGQMIGPPEEGDLFGQIMRDAYGNEAHEYATARTLGANATTGAVDSPMAILAEQTAFEHQWGLPATDKPKAADKAYADASAQVHQENLFNALARLIAGWNVRPAIPAGEQEAMQNSQDTTAIGYVGQQTGNPYASSELSDYMNERNPANIAWATRNAVYPWQEPAGPYLFKLPGEEEPTAIFGQQPQNVPEVAPIDKLWKILEKAGMPSAEPPSWWQPPQWDMKQGALLKNVTITEDGAEKTIPANVRSPYAKPEETTALYVLQDPITGEFRYVGQSVSPSERLVQHAEEFNEKGFSHPKTAWEAELYRTGQHPDMFVFDWVAGGTPEAGVTDPVDELEQIWIGYMYYFIGNSTNVDVPSRKRWEELMTKHGYTPADLDAQMRKWKLEPVRPATQPQIERSPFPAFPDEVANWGQKGFIPNESQWAWYQNQLKEMGLDAPPTGPDYDKWLQGAGPGTAKLLREKYPTWGDLARANPEDLNKIKGVSEKMAYQWPTFATQTVLIQQGVEPVQYKESYAPVPANVQAQVDMARQPDGTGQPAAPPDSSGDESVYSVIQESSKRMGIDPAVAASVFATESGGAGFGEDGRLKIRFEPQVLKDSYLDNETFSQYFKITPGDYVDQYYRMSPDAEWVPIHESQANEHAALQQAVQVAGAENAYRSTSMGATQVLGMNYEDVGYKSAEEMFQGYGDPKTGDLAQARGFFSFVEANGLTESLQQKDLSHFVDVYNGADPGSRWHTTYTNKMQRFIDDPSTLPENLRTAPPGMPPAAVTTAAAATAWPTVPGSPTSSPAGAPAKSATEVLGTLMSLVGLTPPSAPPVSLADLKPAEPNLSNLSAAPSGRGSTGNPYMDWFLKKTAPGRFLNTFTQNPLGIPDTVARNMGNIEGKEIEKGAETSPLISDEYVYLPGFKVMGRKGGGYYLPELPDGKKLWVDQSNIIAYGSEEWRDPDYVNNPQFDENYENSWERIKEVYGQPQAVPLEMLSGTAAVAGPGEHNIQEESRIVVDKDAALNADPYGVGGASDMYGGRGAGTSVAQPGGINGNVGGGPGGAPGASWGDIEPLPGLPEPAGRRTMLMPFDAGVDAQFTQGFGENAERYEKFGLAGHEGADWLIPPGTELRAPIAGKVTRVGWDPNGWGNYVEITNEAGMQVILAHFGNDDKATGIGVTQGSQVAAGDFVGFSGNTGNSDAPHVHMAVKEAGVEGEPGMRGYLDPTQFLPLDEGGDASGWTWKDVGDLSSKEIQALLEAGFSSPDKLMESVQSLGPDAVAGLIDQNQTGVKQPQLDALNKLVDAKQGHNIVRKVVALLSTGDKPKEKDEIEAPAPPVDTGGNQVGHKLTEGMLPGLTEAKIKALREADITTVEQLQAMDLDAPAPGYGGKTWGDWLNDVVPGWSTDEETGESDGAEILKAADRWKPPAPGDFFYRYRDQLKTSPAEITKLSMGGYTSLEDLARTNTTDLSINQGIERKSARMMIDEARKLLGWDEYMPDTKEETHAEDRFDFAGRTAGLVSANRTRQLWETELNGEKITTGEQFYLSDPMDIAAATGWTWSISQIIKAQNFLRSGKGLDPIDMKEQNFGGGQPDDLGNVGLSAEQQAIAKANDINSYTDLLTYAENPQSLIDMFGLKNEDERGRPAVDTVESWIDLAGEYAYKERENIEAPEPPEAPDPDETSFNLPGGTSSLADALAAAGITKAAPSERSKTGHATPAAEAVAVATPKLDELTPEMLALIKAEVYKDLDITMRNV